MSYFVKTQNDLWFLRVIRASGLIQPCMWMLPAFRGKEEGISNDVSSGVRQGVCR